MSAHDAGCTKLRRASQHALLPCSSVYIVCDIVAKFVCRYWLGAQAAVRQMLKQEVAGPAEVRGKVINISSQHGMVCW